MFNLQEEDEEEKVDNSEKIIKRRTRNFLINNENKTFKEKEINSNFFDNTHEISSSTKSLKNNNEKYLKGIYKLNTHNIANKHNDDNKIFPNLNKRKNLEEEISLNKNEIYNAFIFFQQLLNKEKYANKNKDYIKKKLFEFILEKKKEDNKIKLNNNLKINEKFFSTHDCLNFYSKPLYNYNIFQFRNKNLIKSSSFSYNTNCKQKLIHNYFNLTNGNIKEIQKSASQIFDELILTDNNKKDKTFSVFDSKYSNHEYSFDLKHKEKNEISFQSIPEKEKQNNKYFDFDDNNFVIESYNSYNKELEHKNSFKNRSEKILKKNNFNKYNFSEDLLIESQFKKNKKLKLPRENEENDELNKCLNDKELFKEKLINISPSKNKNEEYFIRNNNFKIKNKESFIEPEKNIMNEIKVNKSRILSNKEILINEKLKELDEEIKQFHEERKRMELIKDEYENLKIKLLKDIKEFNLKKQNKNKYFGNNNGGLKNIPEAENKFIMTITQHNKSLILNNDRKTEIIKLLRKRIYQLENIIKNKNKSIQDNKKIHENIVKRIKENNINISTKKKKDIKKKVNDDYLLRNKKLYFKGNKGTCSVEKIKENNKNDFFSQNVNKNINFNNNLNKIFFETKNTKKSANVSYRDKQKYKNNFTMTKVLNFNNLINNSKNNYEQNHQAYNLTTIESINKKYNNNTFKGNVNNSKIYKANNKVENSNFHIYEKLIKNQKERENKYNRIKLNINSVRDFGEHKKIMKKLKTEFHKDNDKEKFKKIIDNNHYNESKNFSKNYQRSQGKNSNLNRLEQRIGVNKNNSNSYFFGLNQFNIKNNKKKNIPSQVKNTIDYDKTLLKEINRKNNKENNSLDNKVINNKNYLNYKELKYDENIEGYDFTIPEKYSLMNNGEVIDRINSDGKIINIYENNKKEIIFQSGVRKEIFPDGYQLIHFPNGDMKQKFVGEEEKIIYFYNETNTVQTTFKNGINIFKFNNGQIEKHYPDGSKYIFYANGLRRKISKNGTEEVFFTEEKKKFKEEIKNQIVDII